MSYMPMKMPFEPGSPYGQKSGYPEQLPPQPGTRDIEEPGTAPLGPPGAGGPPGTFGSDPGNVPVGGWYGGPRYGGGRYGGPRGGWGGGYGWGPPRGGYGGGYGGPMRGGGGYGQPSQTTRAYAPPPFGVVGDGPGGTIPENFKPTQDATASTTAAPAQQPVTIQQPVGVYGGGRNGGYGGYAPPRMGGVRYNPYDPPRFPQQPLLQQGGVLQANNVNGIKPQQPPQLFPTGGIKPARTPEAMTKPQASPYQTPPIAAGMETDEEKKKRAMLAPEQPGMPMTKPELM